MKCAKWRHTQRITVSAAEKLLAEQDEYITELTTNTYELTEETDKTSDEVNRAAKQVASSSREKERQEALAKEARAGREKGDGKVDELCSWYCPSAGMESDDAQAILIC